MDVAPMVYDDFNNPANEGSYAQGLWELRADRDQVAQRDGVMVFMQQGKPREGAGLAASKYHEISLDRPIFFEARLMLSPDANAGNVNLELRTELSPDEEWYAQCLIDNPEGEAWAGCFNEAIRHGQGDVTYSSESIPVPFGSWHTLRMEVDPATMTFNYFVDGQFVGSHIPLDAERLRKARFTLSIGIYQHSAGALTSYMDDVRVGPLEALTAVPIPSEAPRPVSPGERPAEAREVRPCDWEGHGPGLCIYPVGEGVPTKVLEDTELEVLHSHASWSPDGQRIAFAAIGPGERPGEDTSIYIVNANGSGLTELPSVCNDVHPAWSPDGEWLAFHSCGNLAIMHPDGSDPTVIWHWEDGGCVEQPQWSPDSQWIAVSMLMGGCEGAFPMTREVRVISRDGAIVTTVATITHKDEECFRPEVAFSPDGTQVAYFDADCRPWIVNADGSGQPTPLDDFPYWWTSASYPQWGGKKGAPPPKPVPSAQEEGKVVEPCEGVKPPQICVRGAESDRGTQVTDSLGFEMIGGLSWSPDGQQIVFPAGSDFEVTQQYDHKLYVINADGSDLRQATSGDANDADPAWSPDGDWIAFHRNCGLWVVRPDGSDERMLLESSGEFCAMAMMWSRDSQRIAFLNRPDKSALREIQVINRDGTDHRVVHSFERLEWGNIAWNPDGRQIACWYGDGSKEEGLLINADGSGEPKRMDRMPWSWLPNFWPQWSEGEFVPPPPPASAPEAGPVPTDPWGQVVIPPGDAIHIGLVADFSGSVRQLGPANEGAVQMALEDQGPIKGFSVSFMTADGGCNNEMGAAAAQAMISDPLIVGVVGHTCSSSCAPGAPVYEGAHLVMISPSCTAPDLSGPGYQVFNRVAIRDDQGGDERNAHVVNTDIYQDFARRYQDRYSQSLGSTEIGFFAAYAYDATVILIKAIERVAVVDEAGNLVIGREALARAVRATPGHTGVTGVISFDDKGDRVP
jgi:ABC-type branched-subunit amino acid transport system substrate-binding protein/Tol biopolymer transport system component